ncbi:MAG: hypothetical protein AMXMBFR4_22220 [Candidatus Hydrogenedentota bacterium]
MAGILLFSVSPSNFDKLLGYIRNQDPPYERMTFQHGVVFDERYVWDLAVPFQGDDLGGCHRGPGALPLARVGVRLWRGENHLVKVMLRR